MLFFFFWLCDAQVEKGASDYPLIAGSFDQGLQEDHLRSKPSTSIYCILYTCVYIYPNRDKNLIYEYIRAGEQLQWTLRVPLSLVVCIGKYQATRNVQVYIEDEAEWATRGVRFQYVSKNVDYCIYPYCAPSLLLRHGRECSTTTVNDNLCVTQTLRETITTHPTI